MSTTARIDELRKKFEENPRRYFAPLANEYRKSGDLAQAIALCREHLPKQPGHMSGYIVFGQALYESGDLAEARAVFEQALALDPENLIALRHLGDIARDTGDTTTARRWYERVLDADPRNDDIAAQLAGLATGFTPASTRAVVPSFDALARANTTPAGSISAIGLGALPTPDSVLRAVDVDAFTARTPHHSPLDLDAIEESAVHAQTTVPSTSVPRVPESGPEAVTEAVTEGVTVWADDDPFEYPESSTAVSEAAASGAGYGEVTIEPPPEEFEEGLMAPEWPDTTELVSRVVTPRSFTPPAVQALSDEAVEDAATAFGRESHEAAAVSVDANASSEPVELSMIEDVAVSSHGQMGDESPIHDEPSAQGEASIASDGGMASGSWTPVVPDSTGVAMDVVPLDDTADAVVAESALFDVIEEQPFDTLAPQSREAEAVSSETVESSAADVAEGVDVAEVVQFAEVAEVFPAVEVAQAVEVPQDDVLSIEEHDKEGASLPWIAVDEASPSSLDVDTAAEPGLEEIVEAFADDARAAGDEGPLTIAALDEAVNRTPSAGTPTFVTETMAELLVAQGFVGRAVDVYDELVRRRPTDPVLSARLDELRATLAASDSAPMDMPTAEMSIQDMPTVEMPVMPVPTVLPLTDESAVLDLDAAPAALEHDLEHDLEEAATFGIAATYAVETAFEPTTPDMMFAVEADEADTGAGNSVAATAVPSEALMPESVERANDLFDEQLDAAVAEAHAHDPWADSFSAVVSPTPRSATPVFAAPSVALHEPPMPTPHGVAAVTPYARPAIAEELPPRRSAREWFASLAARRVPRRTPSTSSPTVEERASDGLSSLFGTDSSMQDDAAARALADAFAPVSPDDLQSGDALDFEYARSTPAYTPTVGEDEATARSASSTPRVSPSVFTPGAAGPAVSRGEGNAGFAFDKFFPDPAMRAGTPPPSAPEAPVTDDLAQFSAWLKGLGNT